MKELILDRARLLSCIIRMNKNSLTLVIDGVEYFVYRRVFNTILSDASIPIFVIERTYMGKKTNWLAIPSSI